MTHGPGLVVVLGCVAALAAASAGRGAGQPETVRGQPGATDTRADPFGDPLPPGAVARLGTVRFRQGQPISALAFSRTGKTLVSVGGPDIHFWDAATGRPRRAVHQLADVVAMSPDGARLATGSDRSVRLYSMETGAAIRSVGDNFGPFQALAFSPDGKLLAGSTATPAGPTQVWRVSDGSPLLQLHEGAVGLALSPDGKLLAACSEEPRPAIRLVRLADGRELFRLREAGAYPSFSANGQLLAARCRGAAVACWRVPAGKEVFRFKYEYAGIDVVLFAPRGRLLAAMLAHRSVRVWDMGPGKERHRFPASRWGWPLGAPLAFSPDAKFLAAGGGDDRLRLWDVATGKRSRRLAVDDDPRALAFSPDGRRLAAGGGGNTVHVWDLATGKELNPTNGHHAPVKAVVFSTDGKRLFSGGEDESLRTWEPTTGRRLQRSDAHPEGVRSLALSPDGKVLASIGEHNPIRFWDARTGRLLREFESELPINSTLVFSPDGRWLAAGVTGRGERVRVWRTAAMTPERSFEGHQGEIYAVVFSPDGTLLASASHDGTVRLWDLGAGRERERFDGDGDPVYGLAFSPDGRTLAATTDQLLLWDVPSGRPVWRWAGDEEERLLVVRFSPDGRTVAAAGEEGIIYLREVATGEEIAHIHAHDGWVPTLAFSPDGRLLASGGADTSVLVWRLPPPPAGRSATRARLGRAELGRLWLALGARDAGAAYRAVGALASVPAVGFLKEQLRPVRDTDAGRTGQLIAELDDKQFAVRERAARELAGRGESARPALRRALAGRLSPEARRRAEALLKDLDGQPVRSAAVLQGIRAVAVLEQIGTPEAMALLRELAQGLGEARLTREARGALDRLERVRARAAASSDSPAPRPSR
jgi:WD40 repeat protein